VGKLIGTLACSSLRKVEAQALTQWIYF